MSCTHLEADVVSTIPLADGDVVVLVECAACGARRNERRASDSTLHDASTWGRSRSARAERLQQERAAHAALLNKAQEHSAAFSKASEPGVRYIVTCAEDGSIFCVREDGQPVAEPVPTAVVGGNCPGLIERAADVYAAHMRVLALEVTL